MNCNQQAKTGEGTIPIVWIHHAWVADLNYDGCVRRKSNRVGSTLQISGRHHPCHRSAGVPLVGAFRQPHGQGASIQPTRIQPRTSSPRQRPSSN